MHVVDVHERAIAISRYEDRKAPSGGLTTSIVAVVTDVIRDGRQVVGYGFSSIGRFAQSGLIRERFAPRLIAATAVELANRDGTNIDPFRAWNAMMKDEKPGGHGERCVAVGTLDMAIWDAAAKIAAVPLHWHLADATGMPRRERPKVPVYAGGGYYHPTEDLPRLSDEIRRYRGLGYERVKIKIGGTSIARDLNRIDTAISRLAAPNHLAVDAMNSYDANSGISAAVALAPYGLWWFEDICDPLDFETLTAIATAYHHPIAAGEALFSAAEARLLGRHGGLRRDKDILLFDPVHCYGISGYLQVFRHLVSIGWRRSAFWPHGGHLFCLHLVAALGLGGAESNPLNFQPFGGYADGTIIDGGLAVPPDVPGIGFEAKDSLRDLFQTLHVS